MKFTIYRGAGFIGKRLVNYLRRQGYDVYVPDRDSAINANRYLGYFIYAIGLTGDFRTRPFDTFEPTPSI
jgi:nucleoside-diphosphate-sugar epimerase